MVISCHKISHSYHITTSLKKKIITIITHTVFTENKEAREGLFSCLVHTYGLGFFTRTCVYKTNAGISTWIFKPVTEKHAGITEVVRCMSARALALSTYTHYIAGLRRVLRIFAWLNHNNFITYACIPCSHS